MGLKYKFEIDREVCFIHWLQNMAGKWSWHFQKNLHSFFYLNASNLDDKEKSHLESFRNFLKEKESLKGKDGAGNWLWWRYANKSLAEKKEKVQKT